MTLTLSRPQEAHLTNGTKRSRAIPTGAPTTEIRKFLDQRREARAYAERWYQSLRKWAVVEERIPTGSRPAQDSGTEFLTLGTGGPVFLTHLLTPMGWVDERRAGQAITDMTRARITELVQQGKMLDRLRRKENGCMESLLRGPAWSTNRERAVRYGVAALVLAVRLRDPEAEEPLRLLRLELGAFTS